MIKFLTKDYKGKYVLCRRNPEIKPKDIVQDFIFRDKILKEDRQVSYKEANKAIELGFTVENKNGKYYLGGNVSREWGDWFPF